MARCMASAIELPVSLGARGPRTAGPFERLSSRNWIPASVGHAPHQPVERIDLAHQMALAEPTNGGVAGHFADGAGLVGQQGGACASARRSARSFGAGVASANDNHIIA
jgi:hypothetical protein